MKLINDGHGNFAIRKKRHGIYKYLDFSSTQYWWAADSPHFVHCWTKNAEEASMWFNRMVADTETESDSSRRWYFNLIPRLRSAWIGIHYSARNRALCINVIPFLTLRIGRTAYVRD